MTSVPSDMPGELSETTIRDNLSCLGKHPFTMNHAYLALKAPSQNIGDITTIAKFPNLMYVNLSNNFIEDLTPLSSLPGLVELDVRHNKLKSCLDFAPQRCTSSSAWSSGQKAVGSMLTVAILSNNRISDMGDLTAHEFLECLVLSENLITKITGLQNLQYLQVLDLSYNRINRIEGLDGLLILELNLAGNHLVDVSGLQGLSRLSVLNIANNHIRSLGPLNECTQLHNVDAKDNDIGTIRQVEFLSELQWMHHLELTGNPCCAKLYYRFRVAFRLPNLQMLDGTTISAEEKVRIYFFIDLIVFRFIFSYSLSPTIFTVNSMKKQIHGLGVIYHTVKKCSIAFIRGTHFKTFHPILKTMKWIWMATICMKMVSVKYTSRMQ